MKHLPLVPVWLVWITWISPAFAASPPSSPKFCKAGSGPSISSGRTDLSTLPEITARTYEFTGAAQDLSGPRGMAFSYSGEAPPTAGKILLLRRQDREYMAVRIRRAAPSDHKVFVRVLCRYEESFEHPGANDLLTAIEKTGEILAGAPDAPPPELAPEMDAPDLGSPPPPESLPE